MGEMESDSPAPDFGGARQRKGLGVSGGYDQPKPAPMSATMSPEAREALDTPSVSAPGPAAQAQRIAAAATSQKAAMVNQAARQQSAASGTNNITINKEGDTQNNISGEGGGGSSQVVVVKSQGDMPKIGAKIAYGMGL